uniref:Uncharacterized protein n=1 Tax=Aegilops tauschii TaxID=37682 RepID=N1QSZ6_AEGTA
MGLPDGEDKAAPSPADPPWSDSDWSEDDDDEGLLSFEDTGEVSDADSDGPEEEEENDDPAAAQESDSSEDEVAPRNTVGDVPLEWYKDEEHIGFYPSNSLESDLPANTLPSDSSWHFFQCQDQSLGLSAPVFFSWLSGICVQHIAGKTISYLERSSSSDGTIRVWEVETGRCLKVFNVGADVHHISWNPSPDRPILAAIVYAFSIPMYTIFLVAMIFCFLTLRWGTRQLLHVEEPTPEEADGDKKPAVRWVKSDKFDGITLIHHKIYDLQKAEVVKKLESGLREISSMLLYQLVHIGFVILSCKPVVRLLVVQYCLLDFLTNGSAILSYGKLCWFDTDLSTKPYKMLKNHSKDITSVTFHRRYPLSASSSEDCTAYVFHGMVYADLNQNPLIVPLEILRGHSSSDSRGVLDCKFYPRQPWLFTAGADSKIRLYCEILASDFDTMMTLPREPESRRKDHSLEIEALVASLVSLEVARFISAAALLTPPAATVDVDGVLSRMRMGFFLWCLYSYSFAPDKSVVNWGG